MIKDILRGKSMEAQDALDALDDTQILWYPSAGNDYRDVIEYYRERVSYDKAQKPTLFIHSDYHCNGVKLNVGEVIEESIYGKYAPTYNIVIENIFELELIPDYHFNINREYIVFNSGRQRGKIYLLDIRIIILETGCEIKSQIIYFLFENLNFLEEVLLKNKIKVSHIVKVRDGSGYGGGRINHAILRAFFDSLDTMYFITDNQNYAGELEQNILKKLISKYKIEIKDFKHEIISQVPKWSDLSVDVCKINLLEENLTIPDFFDNHY